MRPALVARFDQQLCVRAHERHRHGHLRAIGKHEIRPVSKLLDDAEDVVPASGVEPARVIAQLVKDLLHLERSQDRLDEDGGADRASRNAERILREVEDVIPEPRLEVAFELGQIEVGTAALAEKALRVVEEVQAEIEEAAGDRLSASQDMALVEMPAAGTHDQRGHLLVELVLLPLGAREREGPLDRLDQVDLALDEVRPGRGVRVLEVRHENTGARVEGVDEHLAIGWTRDLDPAVLQIFRRRRHAPF